MSETVLLWVVLLALAALCVAAGLEFGREGDTLTAWPLDPPSVFKVFSVLGFLIVTVFVASSVIRDVFGNEFVCYGEGPSPSDISFYLRIVARAVAFGLLFGGLAATAAGACNRVARWASVAEEE